MAKCARHFHPVFKNVAVHLHLHLYLDGDRRRHSLPIFVGSRIIAFVQNRLVSVQFSSVWFFIVLLQWHRISNYPLWFGMCSSVVWFSLLIIFSVVSAHKIATISVLNEITKPYTSHKNKRLQNIQTTLTLNFVSIQQASLIGANKTEHNGKRLSVCWVNRQCYYVLILFSACLAYNFLFWKKNTTYEWTKKTHTNHRAQHTIRHILFCFASFSAHQQTNNTQLWLSHWWNRSRKDKYCQNRNTTIWERYRI